MTHLEAPPNSVNREVRLDDDWYAIVTPQLGATSNGPWHVGHGGNIHAHLHATSDGYSLSDALREEPTTTGPSWTALIRAFYQD